MDSLMTKVNSFATKYEAFITGCDSIEEIGLWDKETLGEMEAFYANDMASIVMRLIATDGIITEKEVEYFNQTFDFDYTLEELTEVYDSCKDNIVGHAFDESFENGITYMRRINSKLADAYKELLALICDIIINSDGIVAEAEVDAVKGLKAMCE